MGCSILDSAFAANDGVVKNLEHPKAVYVREQAIVAQLDDWIATLFAEDNLESTCEALALASVLADTDPK